MSRRKRAKDAREPKLKAFFLYYFFFIHNEKYTKISNKVCEMRTKRILFIQYYNINISKMYLSLPLLLLLISLPTFCWEDSQTNDFHSYIHTHTVRIYDFNFEFINISFVRQPEHVSFSLRTRKMAFIYFKFSEFFLYFSKQWMNEDKTVHMNLLKFE